MNLFFCIIAALLNIEVIFAQGLPKDIKWISEKPFEPIADTQATKGGSINSFLLSYPLTFRTVGPDSNGSFRGVIGENNLGLITIHPNTEQILPGLATHWAYGNDKRSMYFRLDAKARWSDGKPVTGKDFEYVLEFYRSSHIVAPWYNEYYTNQIESIKSMKDSMGRTVIAVILPVAKPDLWMHCNIAPIPKHHFHPLDKNFIREHNWKIQPNTGPYQITKFKKGRLITLERKKNWWAKDRQFFKGRFNVDKVRYKVVRDLNIALEFLKKGKIDAMTIVWPEFWHNKTKAGPFAAGYIHKLMAYNDMPRSDYVMVLNMKDSLFQDINVRLAFHHSMNVKKVISQVLRNDYNRLEGISRGHGKYTNEKILARRFDLKMADKYLHASGWIKRGPDGIRIKNEKRLSATVTYGSPQMTKRLVVLKEDAKKAGFELNLKLMDSAGSFKSYLEKQHQIAYMSWSASLRPQYRGRFHSENANKKQTNNLANISLPKLDKYIDAFRISSDENERIKQAKAIQQIIHDEAAHLPLFEVPYYRIAYWGWIKFPKIVGTKRTDGIDFYSSSKGGLFWIDEKQKQIVLEAKKSKQKLPFVEKTDVTFRKN